MTVMGPVELPGDDHEASYYRRYVNAVQRCPRLTGREEVELAKAIEDGKRAQERLDAESGSLSARAIKRLKNDCDRGHLARRRFIVANLRVVAPIVDRYLGMGVTLHDLIQEGNLSLVQAVERFDWRKGKPFSMCAQPWIRRALGLAINGVAPKDPVETAESILKVASFRFLNSLSRRERLVLELRCGLRDGRCRTFVEVARELNVTTQWCQQVVARALGDFWTSDLSGESWHTAGLGTGIALRHRLLVLDDELCEVLQTALCAEGYVVDAAHDSDEALQVINQKPPDLLITDLVHPGLNGLVLTSELRRTSNFPIIVVTAAFETSCVVAALNAGADDYITKPFEMRELLARIRSVLRRSSGFEMGSA